MLTNQKKIQGFLIALTLLTEGEFAVCRRIEQAKAQLQDKAEAAETESNASKAFSFLEQEVISYANHMKEKIINTPKSLVNKNPICRKKRLEVSNREEWVEVGNVKKCRHAFLDSPGVYFNIYTTWHAVFTSPAVVKDCVLRTSVNVIQHFVSFEQCTIEKIRCNAGSDPHIIVLENSLVEKDITFYSRTGIVILKGDSFIKGKVIGGIVIRA